MNEEVGMPNRIEESVNGAGRHWKRKLLMLCIFTGIGSFVFIASEWPRGGWRSLIIVSIIFFWMISVFRRDVASRFMLTHNKWASIFCICIGWVVGMAIEFSITGTGGGPGGFSYDPATSFLISQGFYWVFPLLALYLIRKFHLSYWEVYVTAGLVSIIEIFVLGIVNMIFSPLIILFPFILAFYVTLYASMVTVPLLWVDEKLFWDTRVVRISRTRAVITSFIILGAGSWFVFGIWSAILKTAFGVDLSGAI